MARTTLVGGNVFDGSGRAPFRADIAIEAGRIVDIGSGLPGEVVIDVAGATVVPGFIDCHTHVAYRALRPLEESVALSPSYLTFEAVDTLRRTLDVGVTTVRDAGGADAGYRRAVLDGIVAGPRMLVSLMQLSPSAGPYDARTASGIDTWIDRPGIPRPVADGPDGLRAKVREYVQAGADVIKVFATGHFAMVRDGARRPIFTDAELAAIVDEASRHGLPVMAHAHGAAGAVAAARAGVASIEHGAFLDDEAIEAMKAAGTVYVPTMLATAGLLASANDADGKRLEQVVADHRSAVAAAHAAGVPIAMGTDCPMVQHGRNLEELELLASAGLTPTEALVAATSTAARLVGLEADIGAIAVGRRADLVVIDGDVLKLSDLASRVRAVYQDGIRVASRGTREAEDVDRSSRRGARR